VGTPRAWRLEPLADNIDDDGETAVFLSSAQRKAIIREAERHAAQFLHGLELTGARPKELAAVKVSDSAARQFVWAIERDVLQSSAFAK
jgi:hypothetical protein